MRAVAAIPIVLFHMGVSVLSGGFVGVDIFFVISGFLITSILLRDIQKGRFAFSEFYMRRLRRLGPALFVTLFLSLCVGAFVLSPAHAQEQGRSALAALFSVSNVFFWWNAGYFDTDAIYKPLLHTWSLGVEEQFYFVWPLILLFAWKLGRIGLTMVLLLLSVLSLAAAEFFLQDSPDAVFYLPPFRVFEFGVGAGLGLFEIRYDRRVLFRSLASVVGAALIIFAVVSYDAETRFPGASALVPCLGAGILIWAGPHAWINRLLTSGICVWIGRISYSLYLVHWPVVVFYFSLAGFPDSLAEIVLLTLVTLALAQLMYICVEQPFRRQRVKFGEPQNKVSSRKLLTSSTFAGCSLVFLIGATELSEGFVTRLSPEILVLAERVAAGKDDRGDVTHSSNCFSRSMTLQNYEVQSEHCNPDNLEDVVVVFGDSHASDVWMGLERNFPNRDILLFWDAGCAYSKEREKTHRCYAFYQIVEDWLNKNKAKVDFAIYSQRGAALLKGKPEEGYDALRLREGNVERLRKKLEALTQEGLEIVLWGPRPEFHPPLDVVAGTSRSIEQIDRVYSELDMAPFKRVDERLKHEFSLSPVQYISSHDAICDGDCVFLRSDGYPIIYDYGHWTPPGSDEVLRLMVTKFANLQQILTTE